MVKLYHVVAEAKTGYSVFQILLPSNVYFSFYNSPYIGHKLGTAVDVYFKGEALFPMAEGKVIEVRWFNTPRNRPDGLSREPLLLIRVGQDVVLKVLHVMPSVKPGESLVLGDYIGKVLISGYLFPWSTPHAHFELRDLKDPYRARGAFRLKPMLNTAFYVRSARDDVFEVYNIEKHFIWVKALKPISKGISPLQVLVDNNTTGYIDAGIPHYMYGGLILKDLPDKPHTTFELLGLSLKAYWEKDNVCTFTINNSVRLILPGSSLEFRGLGVYLGNELIKLIPYKTLENLKVGDILKLRLKSI